MLEFLNPVDLGPLRKQINAQHNRIEYLHNYSRELAKYAGYIKNSNVKHKKEIIEHLSKIGKWINYLHTNALAIKKELSALKREIRNQLKNDFEVYHNILKEYIELKIGQKELEQEDIDNLKKQIIEEIKSELYDNFQVPVSQDHIIKESDNAYKVELSNPEKQLLSLLFNENQPLTYQSIAKKLSKSISSVRVYMNSLKSKKDIIEEFVTSNGSKVFTIKNSEIVKTLFNPL